MRKRDCSQATSRSSARILTKPAKHLWASPCFTTIRRLRRGPSRKPRSLIRRPARKRKQIGLRSSFGKNASTSPAASYLSVTGSSSKTSGAGADTGARLINRQNFDRQRGEKFARVLDLKHRIRQVRRKKTGVRRRRDARLRADFGVGKLLNDLRHFRRQISRVRKFHGRNSCRSRFDIGGKRSGKMKQNFLEQAFLGRAVYFYDEIEGARQTLARRHPAPDTEFFGARVQLNNDRFFFLIVD